MGRISALTELTAAEQGDQIPIVDVSTGTTKRITVKNLTGLPDLGWTATGESWSYASWDSATRTGTITVPTDATVKYSPAMRVRFSQSTGGTKYGIITKVTATVLTIFFPVGTTLNNEAIYTPVYSGLSIPYGFSRKPYDWSLSLTSTTTRSISTTSWGSLTDALALPIGEWDLSLKAFFGKGNSASTANDQYRITLSQDATNETNTELTLGHQARFSSSGASSNSQSTIRSEETVTVTTPTTFTLMGIKNSGADNGTIDAPTVPTVIRAVCAYLW